jgi:ribonucleoside-diphosphate reductase alpha subunit
MLADNTNEEMHVVKRNGEKELVSFDKVLNRLRNLSNEARFSKKLQLNLSLVAQKVCSRIYNGVSTSELDELAAQICASLSTDTPEYGILASRIVISNHQKNTSPSFSETMYILYHHKDIHGNHSPLICDKVYKIVMDNKNKLNDVIDYNSDFVYDYFGFKTLERAYLLRVNNKVIERPQHMLMRVSLGIHMNDFKDALNTYKMMSQKYFTHATPTLFNSGTPRPQLSSCFLLDVEDSISGIYKSLSDCAMISKWAGGIGLNVHSIRAKNSHIRGTNGYSNGLTPMLRVFNNTARYVDQGGGKRNGSFAIYLEPWHSDILNWLDLRKNHGNEEERARDLFYGLWIPDLFMKRVKENGQWTLMCPDQCPGLPEVYGEEFDQLYLQYEYEGRGVNTINAQELWTKILTSQIETGTPYMLYKDACNSKSNQKNLGTIKSSNLCTEIIEFTSPTETAVCNLASISLPKFLDYDSEKISQTYHIYSKKNCTYCQIAKMICKEYNINYIEINLDNDKERVEFFEKIQQQEDDDSICTVPQIFLNDKRIGNCQDFIDFVGPKFNFNKLIDVVRTVTKNLNKVIDRNFYPTKETLNSNKRHRPIGIGVQGLADLYAMLKISFDSPEAKKLNFKIFETIYYAALLESVEISKKRESMMIEYKRLLGIILANSNFNKDSFIDLESINNDNKTFLEKISDSKPNLISKKEIQDLINLHHILKPIPAELNREKYLGSYSSFENSPLQKGLFQFNLWNMDENKLSYDWNKLKLDILECGVRNSLLLAPMPTASTSQILGNNECFEPFTSNIYTRRTLAGEFIIVNKYLLNDLINLNLWNKDLKDQILLNDGCIGNLKGIPEFIRNIYKTVWEIKQKELIDQAVDRGQFICQSQSLNLFLHSPSISQLTSMHFYSWEKGLKTGIYYLRTKSGSSAQKFTIDPSKTCENCSA